MKNLVKLLKLLQEMHPDDLRFEVGAEAPVLLAHAYAELLALIDKYPEIEL